MASYLQVENISKSYGTKVLFDKISFNINEGDKIAIIAPNGTGKSSLLNILAGKDSSDSGGSIKFLKNISIAFLEQTFDFDPNNTIKDEVLKNSTEINKAISTYHDSLSSDNPKAMEKAIADMDRLDGWNFEKRIEQVLTPLKLYNPDQLMSELSGGEVKRVALATVLLRKADFLILDEPTNHLDIEAIEYLEDYLSKSRCTLFMVTHDRYFLDRVCNTILELDAGSLFTYKGNYSYFLEKREERISNQVSEIDKAKNLLKRELEWIRATPCARTGKAKYRIDAFYDLKDRAEGRIDEKKVNINVQSSRLGKKIINCLHLTKYYDTKCMLDDFTYNFSRFEKIGIVGDNGVGKSTFLNMLTGNILPSSGEIEQGETIVFGYYHQAGMNFNPQDTVFDAAHNIAEVVTLADGKQLSVNNFLNYFLFPPSTHNTKIERLSGGEKRRLYLLTVLMKNPNFLILDEPTNDLDIMTLNVLEDYLKDFSGCLLIVSHDRYFLDKLADHVFIFKGDGKVKDYVGKCSEYRAYIKSLEEENIPAKKVQPEEKIGKTKEGVAKRKLSYKEQRELSQIEQELPLLEKEKYELENKISSSNQANYEELASMSHRIGELIDQIDMHTLRWLELSE